VVIGGSSARVNQLLKGPPKNKEPTFRPTPTTFDYSGLGHEIWSESLTTARGIEASLSWNLLRYVGTPLGPAHPEPSKFEHRLTSSIRSSVGVPCLISAASATPRSGTPFESESKEMCFTFLTSYQVGRRWQIAEPKKDADAFADPQPESPNKWPKPMPLEATVVFDLISIPTQKAPALLAGTEDLALYESLKKLISQGAAKRELALSGRLHEGKCVLDEGRVHDFSTEFDPPQLLEVSHITSAEDLRSLQAGNTKTIGTPTGTTTESLPLGAHVELEATRESQGWTVKAESKIRKLIGERNYSGCTQPLFEFQSLSTERFMEPGEPQLLGTLSPAQNTGTPEVNKDGRTWFAFLKMSLP